MAGLYDSDIKLDENWQLTSAVNGDVPLASDTDCFIQDIRLEALSQEGELFYDELWGWSLMDFIQTQDNELTRLEIEQRIKTKLSRREEIDNETIKTVLSFEDDKVSVKVAFKFINDSRKYNLDILLDRVRVEVVMV
ncbi:hypothetical protein KQI38_09255 [Tissierella carlieri]|uniref:hypothetical protein n=1 Tax=Tissierella carlieri TaxID=689904 RepID=UPI001C102913|nr:hypothetical protein [Tissierella carlieri]MBU5312213.1 hypothetical protein [Tissierella carlieri]